MALSILGMGLVSSLGGGIDPLRSALRGEGRPNVMMKPVETAHGVVEAPLYAAEPEGLDRFVPKRSLRRVDRFVRMALLASFLAFEDAGMTPGDAPARVGLAFGTGYGPLATTFEFQDTIIHDGDRCASPTAFAGSVHNAPASQVSIAMKIEGPCQTITAFGHTVAGALRTAEAWLNEGVVDTVLVGLGDEFHPLGAYALANMDATFCQEMTPLDFSLCTYRPGEMFSALLLGRAGEGKAKRGAIEEIQTLDREYERAREIISRHDAAILGATGRRSDFAYESLRLPGQRYAVYTPYYGGAPTSFGMDLAAGIVALEERTLFPAPDSVHLSHHWNMPREPQALAEGAALACVDCNEDGVCTIVSLKR